MPAETHALASGDPPSVGIVEDQADFRSATVRGMRRLLPRSEFEDFGSADDALAMWTGRAPSVVLMDIGLPGTSGLDAIATLSQRHPETRVLMLTVAEDQQKIVTAMRSGARGYLLKVQPLAEVAQAIRLAHAGGVVLAASISDKLLSAIGPVSTPRDSDQRRRFEALNERERKVLDRMAAGRSRKQVALDLDLNKHTLDYVLRCIYRKLEVGGAAEAVAVAVRQSSPDVSATR